MDQKINVIIGFLFLTFSFACERPEAPDFNLSHRLQAPLTVENSYQFLGGHDALIDTTQDDFDSLFTIDGNGLVRLSQEEKFDFANLEDVLPNGDVDPVRVNMTVNDLKLTNFSSSSPAGSLSFTGLTDFSGTSYQKGSAVPPYSTPRAIRIENLNPDYFERATIAENSSLGIDLINQLGLDISRLNITLISNGRAVGEATVNEFEHSTEETALIPVPKGTVLTEVALEIDVTWQAQTMRANAGNLMINQLSGENLIVSELRAAIEPLELSKTGAVAINNNSFTFGKSEHYLSLNNFDISVDINNSIELGVEDLKITFPDIRRKLVSDKDYDKPLVINLSDIPSKNAVDGAPSRSTEFYAFPDNRPDEYFQIFSTDNNIEYKIEGSTENTQKGPGSGIRTINAEDELEASVEIKNIKIKEAFGIIEPRFVLLNDDVDSDESLNIFNSDEAHIFSINGVRKFSERISEIAFANPVLSSSYQTNMQINSTIYASIIGTNSSGEKVFLSADKGSKYYVSPSEIPPQLTANSNLLSKKQLIKFNVTPSPDGSITEAPPVVFDTSRTNVADFFNNLPTRIRFIGVALLNGDGGEETVSRPIIFEPKLRAELPFNFSADNASFKDTINADLGILPGANDERGLSRATLTIEYANGLPLNLDLSVIMLNKNGNEVTRYPQNSQHPLIVKAASVDNQYGFVEDSGNKNGKLQVNFTDDQLDILNQTRSIVLNIRFDTTNKEEVRFRAEDSISFRLKISTDLTSTFN